MSGNRLESIPSGAFSEVAQLMELRLNNNPIGKPLRKNRKEYHKNQGVYSILKWLETYLTQSFHYSHIKCCYDAFPVELPDLAFSDLRQLVRLELGGCSISSVAPRAFAGLDNLNRLALHRNRLAKCFILKSRIYLTQLSSNGFTRCIRQ